MISEAEFMSKVEQYTMPFLEEKEPLRRSFLIQMCLVLPFAFCLDMIGLFLSLIYMAFMIILKYLNEKNTRGFKGATKTLRMLKLPYCCKTVRYFSNSYKKVVRPDIMRRILPLFGDLRFQNTKLEIEVLNASLLFDCDYCDRADCLSGTYQEKSFKIQECNLFKADGRWKKLVFRGFMIHTEIDKAFSGHTNVIEDSFFNRIFNQKGLEKADLECVVFEKTFDVFTNKQVEARYLLTPVFMEKLVKLGNTSELGKVEASFFNNQLLIAVETNHNFFELISFFRKIKVASFRKFYQEIQAIYEIFDTIHETKKGN